MKRQGGWVGMVMLLLALALVAWLARDALMKYGRAPDTESVRKQAGTPPAAAVESKNAAAPANPLEAARSLEKSLQQQSEQRGGGN